MDGGRSRRLWRVLQSEPMSSSWLNRLLSEASHRRQQARRRGAGPGGLHCAFLAVSFLGNCRELQKKSRIRKPKPGAGSPRHRRAHSAGQHVRACVAGRPRWHSRGATQRRHAPRRAPSAAPHSSPAPPLSPTPAQPASPRHRVAAAAAAAPARARTGTRARPRPRPCPCLLQSRCAFAKSAFPAPVKLPPGP